MQQKTIRQVQKGDYLNREFNNRLFGAKIQGSAGADELWTLYNALSEDCEDVMSKLDSYKDDASGEAQDLYYSIMRSI